MSKPNFNEIKKIQNEYIENTSEQFLKSSGQFFTPEEISIWMSKWILKLNPKTILDPSVGFGSLIHKFYNKKNIKITAVEKDKNIFKFVKKIFKSNTDIYNEDFLNFNSKIKYDAIIANPPYIRFQKREIEKKIFEKFEKIVGRKISKLSNIYVLFIIQIIRYLEDKSRAAIIIPNEWMNANFGETLKNYLRDTKVLSKIIYISHESLVFDKGNLSTSCILLIEKNKNKNKEKVDLIYVKNFVEFFKTDPNSISKNESFWINFTYDWEYILTIKKWDSLFFEKKIELKNQILIKKLGKSKRGIATGSNKYFLRNYKFINSKSLDFKNFKPCISKASFVKGTIFSQKDFSKLKSENKNIFLFDPINLKKSEKILISEGEKLGINKLYLPSHRKIWFNHENRNSSKIWVPVFNRDRVKFIFNETSCRSLTCFHSLDINLDDYRKRALVGLLNLDDLQESILTQKRVYGGGLIKLEPRDILDIQIPDVSKYKNSSIKKLNNELDYQNYCYQGKIIYKSRIKISELD